MSDPTVTISEEEYLQLKSDIRYLKQYCLDLDGNIKSVQHLAVDCANGHFSAMGWPRPGGELLKW